MLQTSRCTIAILAVLAAPYPFSPVGAQGRAVPAARIDSIFARFTAAGSPGCAVAVSRAGEVAFAKGYGLADIEHAVPITPQTPFYIASTSKQFTAYATLLLAQDGKLSLDDDVRKWVPELHDFGRRITIRHLLNHTSGLRDYFALFAARGYDFDALITDDDFLKLVGKQRTLNYTPGAAYSYTNTGYVLLSIIVKRASGKSLDEFTRERIFTPLGMTRSQFRDDHRRLIADRALAYAPIEKGYQLAIPNFDVVGDGGLFSTVEDLAKWDGNFYRTVAGNADTWRMMRERGVLSTGDTISYASGVMVGSYRGTPAIEHGGAYGGYRAELKRLPERRLSAAVLCNHAMANTTALANAVVDAVLGDSLPPAAVASAAPLSLTADDRTTLIGRYVGRTMDTWLVIEADTLGALRGRSFFGEFPLVKVDATRFRLGELPIEIRVRRTPLAGVVRELGIGGNGWEILDPVAARGGRIPASIAGRFVNRETDATLVLAVQGDSIVATGSTGQPITFKAFGGDRYVAGPMLLTATGGARQVLLSTGRSTRVAYDRQ